MADDEDDAKKGRRNAREGRSELVPPSPPSAPVETHRRVYALPADLVDRIVEFQKEKGYPSEVEAVRRLLDDALKSRDTLERLIGRFMTRLGALRSTADVSKDILVAHPLVKTMSFSEDSVEFAMKDGWSAKIQDDGNVWVWDPKGQNLWSWEPDSDRFGPGKITDDIPF